MSVASGRFLSLLACLATLLLATAPRADAACNLIPGTAKTYDSIVGAANRPFAAPGELLELRLRPCDTSSPGFLPNAADQVVTDQSMTLGAEKIIALPLREAREVFEREYLLAQVTRFGGNISRTASFVGMERSALHLKLRLLGINAVERPTKPEA